ncbi:MAG: PAS domain-containing protein [Anaerolineae bacterium]|nr:MAG: PAS domain-containing protein [Anaerolineae bacterium]
MRTGSLPDLTAIFKRSPGRAEWAFLFDLLPSAALLVDLRTHQIHLGNAAAHSLTHFSVGQLSGRPLNEILIELTPQALAKSFSANKTSWHTPLRAGSGRPARIEVSAHHLGSESDFAVFLLQPHRGSSLEDEMLAQRFQALPVLAGVPRQPDLRAAILQALQAGQLLTGATTLAFYQIDSDHQRLCRKYIWGLAESLPDELPLNEAENLRVTYTWQPGARPFSELHRCAQTQDFAYLASTPLDPQAAYDGILVVADQIGDPPDHFESMLELLASTIGVTERHTRTVRVLESKLQRQMQTMSQTESIQDVVNDALLFVTPALVVTDLNAKAEALLGYGQDEVHGHPLTDILITSRPILSEIQEILANPAPRDLGNLRLTRRDGQTILVHLRLKPYLMGQAIQRLAIVVTDLSREEQFDRRTQQLEQQAQLGELTAVLAHEIRNPINNISSALQLISMTLSPQDALQEEIQRMQGDCERLEQLMRSVLSFAGSRNYQMDALELNHFLQALVPRWRSRAARTGAEIRLHMPETEYSITADRIAFEQVFTNLIGNALEAMSAPGGIIGIRVGPCDQPGEENLVGIDVSDTGPGIPQDMADKVFAPFITTKLRGTGLGLAITQQIVNAHNGRIDLESFPGGTLFKIKLPIRHENKPL